MRILLMLIIGLCITGCADDLGPTQKQITSRGTILVAPNGRTLYTYDQDEWEATYSQCIRGCEKQFPPFLVTDETSIKAQRYGESSPTPFGNNTSGKYNSIWSTISRPGGARQWTYFGRPLYYYSGDLREGDMGGEDLYGVWHAARIQ